MSGKDQDSDAGSSASAKRVDSALKWPKGKFRWLPFYTRTHPRTFFFLRDGRTDRIGRSSGRGDRENMMEDSSDEPAKRAEAAWWICVWTFWEKERRKSSISAGSQRSTTWKICTKHFPIDLALYAPGMNEKKHSGRVTKWVGGLDLTYNNPPLSSLYSFFLPQWLWVCTTTPWR